MTTSIHESDATVVFSGGEYAGVPYEGEVTILDGWVYLHDEEEYQPRHHVDRIKPNRNSDGVEPTDTPDECPLCRRLGYKGNLVREPAGSVEMVRTDGGKESLHCCERCADEVFPESVFTPYDQSDDMDTA